MTQGERVREIRKKLELSLEKFGEKLGVQKSAVSKIERGEVGLTEQMAKSICREYHVNYDYLIYGDGEMFDDLPQTLIDELCVQYELDGLEKSIIESYLSLNSSEREVIKNFVRGIIAKQ